MGANGVNYEPPRHGSGYKAASDSQVEYLREARTRSWTAMIEAAENAGSTRGDDGAGEGGGYDYLIEQQWNIWGTPIRPSFAFWQPWMVGYNGEEQAWEAGR